MMSRLATVDCHATRSNYLRWSGNALSENVKEFKGDRGLWCDNTHCVSPTISREKPENASHLQMSERFAVIDSDLSHNVKYVRRYLPVCLRMRMRMVRKRLPPHQITRAPSNKYIYPQTPHPLGVKHGQHPLPKKNPI
jgi:hypothetical protein